MIRNILCGKCGALNDLDFSGGTVCDGVTFTKIYEGRCWRCGNKIVAEDEIR